MKYVLVSLGILVSLGSLFELVTLFSPEVLPKEVLESKSIALHQSNRFIFWWTALANVTSIVCGAFLARTGFKLSLGRLEYLKGFKITLAMAILTTVGLGITLVTVLPALLGDISSSPEQLAVLIAMLGAAGSMPLVFGTCAIFLRSKARKLSLNHLAL